MKKILVIAAIAFAQNAFAQSDSTSTGEIVSGEIVIEKNKRIVLPEADKIFLRSTPKSFEDQPIVVDFEIQEPNMEWPDYKSDIPFQSTTDKYPTEKHQNYVKLGYGNYSSPLFEAGLYRTFGQVKTSTKLFHESFNSGPVNNDNSSSASSRIQVSGILEKDNFKLTPTIAYSNQQYAFYGNADRINTGFDSSDPNKISLGEFYLGVDFSGGNNDIKYTLRPTFAITDQNLKAGNGLNKESTINIDGSLNFKIDERFDTGFDVEAYNASYDGGLQADRSLINVNPWISHRKDNLLINAGFTLSSGKIDQSSKTGFYPNVKIEYAFTDTWTIYGKLSGGQSWNSLGQLLHENLFLDDSLAIIQSEYELQFGGGVKGNPLKNVFLELNVNYSSIEGLPFYVPSSSDSSRYTITYDGSSVGVVSLNSNLSYMPTPTSTYGVELEINGYSVETLDRPWHKPAYIFKAYTSHNVKEKLIVSGFLTGIGGIRAPANVDFGYTRLSSFIDLGVSAKYLITSRASAFIDVNNLLNNEYERYLGYPTRGISFKLGGQYRF